MITSKMKQKFIIDVNPSTGEIIEKIKCSSPGEILSEIKLAKKAFKEWSESNLRTRISHLNKIIKVLRTSEKEIAEKITLEMGKPFKRSCEEVSDAIKMMENIISFSSDALDKTIVKKGKLTTEIIPTPYGVVGLISTWNYPVLTPIEILTTSIITGNTVVFKPSEVTPETGKMLYDIFNNELPKGVVNLIQGAKEVCKVLLSAEINLVAFIGTKETGQELISSSITPKHRLVMELSSKNVMIVMENANLDKATNFAIENSLFNTGQNANSVERIYVHHSIFDKFNSLVVNKVKKIKFGNPFDNTDIGPLATEEQWHKVFYRIEESRRKGATILYGGSKPALAGYFLEPTVIIDVNDKHDLMCDETFGPVIAIQKYFSIEEIIEKINKLPFGLCASIWSGNTKKANVIAQKLEVGMVGINRPIDVVSGTSLIGIKQSEYGYMNCKDSLKYFTYPKKYSY